MAKFDIDAHMGNSMRLEWCVVRDKGECLDDLVEKVRHAAMRKFGADALCARWDRIVASNGCVVVRMHV